MLDSVAVEWLKSLWDGCAQCWKPLLLRKHQNIDSPADPIGKLPGNEKLGVYDFASDKKGGN